MNRTSLVYFLAAFLLAGLVVAASAATLTLPLPQGCTLVAVSCPDAPVTPPVTPPVIPPPSAGSCAGYTVQAETIDYPLGFNRRIYSRHFGNSDVLVIHFKTPAADPGTASFTINAAGGAPNVNRVAGLSTAPCFFPTGYSIAIPAGTKSQTPIFNVSLQAAMGIIQLQPNTDYYITVVNRNNFSGGPSCTTADCQVYIDAN